MLGSGQARQGIAREPGAVAAIPPGSNARPARFTILICRHCLVMSINDAMRSYIYISEAEMLVDTNDSPHEVEQGPRHGSRFPSVEDAFRG
jgi:hypothetical protein